MTFETFLVGGFFKQGVAIQTVCSCITFFVRMRQDARRSDTRDLLGNLREYGFVHVDFSGIFLRWLSAIRKVRDGEDAKHEGFSQSTPHRVSTLRGRGFSPKRSDDVRPTRVGHIQVSFRIERGE